MKIRLNKVQKELNVGLSTIVEFLQKNNFEILSHKLTQIKRMKKRKKLLRILKSPIITV